MTAEEKRGVLRGLGMAYSIVRDAYDLTPGTATDVYYATLKRLQQVMDDIDATTKDEK